MISLILYDKYFLGQEILNFTPNGLTKLRMYFWYSLIM